MHVNHPKDSNIQVYYNPDNPKVSVIERITIGEGLEYIGIALILVTFAMAWLIMAYALG